MTQEELYWLEKRLRLKADEEERKIRTKYEIWIRHSKEAYQTDSVFSHYCRPPLLLEIERDKEIEFVRLEILEPVLDEKDRNRLQQLREEKKRKEEEQKKQEEERKRRAEEEERRREEERKRKEEERKRREEEAEKKRKELEELKRKRAEQEKEKAKREKEERKRRIKTVLLWILGAAVVGAIIAAIL